MVVLYTLVLSLTKRLFVALGAALIFGVSASAVHTVTYITAFPHVFSEFLLISSLYTLHRYVEGGERRAAWYWASLALFVLGFLANEGGVVLGAVIVVYYVAVLAGAAPRCAGLHAEDGAVRDRVGAAGERAERLRLPGRRRRASTASAGTSRARRGSTCRGWRTRSARSGSSRRAMEWVWGSIVIGFAIFFLIRGPHIARFAAVGMVIGVMPYVPGKIWTATRYSYMATPFFAILVAVCAGFVHHYAVKVYRPAAHVLAAMALVAVGGLYSWQTIHQTQPFLRATDRWEAAGATICARTMTRCRRAQRST